MTCQLNPQEQISEKFYQNVSTFIQENAFENAVYKIVAFIIRFFLGLNVFFKGNFIQLISLSVAYMRWWTGSTLVQIMACRLVAAKPLSEPMLEYC